MSTEQNPKLLIKKKSCSVSHNAAVDNLKRILPNNLSAEINLSKVNPLKIFHWLKSQNISDGEMLRTFNCGVGFCLIITPYKFNKVKKYFKKEFQPYLIGKISKGISKVKLNGSINWS